MICAYANEWELVSEWEKGRDSDEYNDSWDYCKYGQFKVYFFCEVMYRPAFILYINDY